MPVHVGVTEELGSEIHVIFTIDAPQVEHASITDAATGDDGQDESVSALVGGKSLWTARVSARSAVRPNTNLELAVDTNQLQFFDADSGLSIGHPEATSRRRGARHGVIRVRSSARRPGRRLPPAGLHACAAGMKVRALSVERVRYQVRGVPEGGRIPSCSAIRRTCSN